MFRIEMTGPTSRYCDGVSRRNFLQLGVAGMASIALPEVLWAKEASQTLGLGTKDTSVILIWLDGGPSHMDTYDMKPDAPPRYRGLWTPISTNVPGTQITELFPRQAKVANKFSIVRSLHHGEAGHFPASRRMLTGRVESMPGTKEAKYPSFASCATKVCGARRPGMPPYVSVPKASSVGLKPGHFGASYLGLAHNPFMTGGDPNEADFKIKNIKLPDNLTIDRLEDRRHLRRHFDGFRRSMDTSGAFDAMDRFQHHAFEMVAGPAARKAFDIGTEDPQLRDRYGRHSSGQSTLLARRLVEAGATFVTVHIGGWDHHWDLEKGYRNKLPRVDAAVATLFEDLDSRGLLDQVLVMVCGEFSRTPKMNDGRGRGTPGRDHWGNAMSCVLGGGGVKGGQIIGATDRRGLRPAERPVTPPDIHATVYDVLGVDPNIEFLDFSGRPIPAVNHGKVIHELV